MSNQKRHSTASGHRSRPHDARRDENASNSINWNRAVKMCGLAVAVVLCTWIVFVIRSPEVSSEEAVEVDSTDETVAVWSEKVTNLLWQVDSEHPIAVSYVPENLITLDDSDVQLDQDAADAFEMMTGEMTLPLYAAGGYVSGNDQQAAYDEAYETLLAEGYSEENASLLMEDIMAPGGQDEHQLGLTIDVCTNEELNTAEAFSVTEQADWLEENAWEYGFVCEDEDGFSIRYVGTTHAAVMHSLHLSFSDYLAYLEDKGTSYIETGTDNDLNLVIYYTDSLQEISRQIKEVSGDNGGHYVVVCYR